MNEIETNGEPFQSFGLFSQPFSLALTQTYMKCMFCAVIFPCQNIAFLLSHHIKKKLQQSSYKPHALQSSFNSFSVFLVKVLIIS